MVETRTGSVRLLEDSRWRGRVFTGEWTVAAGGASEVIEPASGKSLGNVGIGNAQDIAAACKTATQAQRAWANVAARERSGVFLKAAAVLEQAGAECAPIVARETGGIPPKGNTK
jgi:benzaldehyde dehydrogenase (NAD)